MKQEFSHVVSCPCCNERLELVLVVDLDTVRKTVSVDYDIS